MSDEIEVEDDAIRKLLKVLPRWQEFIAQERMQIQREAEMAQKVFGKVVADLLSRESWQKPRQNSK